ncbi:MAG: type II toxin-antitoxin system prevent-host-death family antitoxin [Myxococcales bacterium]|nr:type II toxin-antitoxin system prevent-host-death family antitoxin [Myxococcales bacterium]
MNLVKYVTMVRVNVHEAKANLSRYLEAAASGETVLICNRNVPVAELRAIAPRRVEPRPIGLARGTFDVAESFFDPLPADIVDAFEGAE